MSCVRLLALVVAFCAAPLAAHAQNVDPSGDWRGMLTYMPGVEFRVALHLDDTPTADSLDQDMFNLPSTVRVEGRSVMVNVTGVGDYVGSLSEDGAMLTGEWRQGGETWPLDFERGRH